MTNKRESVLELQIALMDLADKISKKKVIGTISNSRLSGFAPYNSEFKQLISELPDNFYLSDIGDDVLLEKIKELTNKINNLHPVITNM